MTQHPYEVYKSITLDTFIQFLYDYMDETKKNPFEFKCMTFLKKDGSEMITSVNPNSLMYMDYDLNEFKEFNLDENMDGVFELLKPYLRKSKIKKLKK